VKPLIIGEAPGKHGDPTKPIEGRIGARLATCCGLSLQEFLDTFDRVNLLEEQPQDNGKGTHFNVKAAAKVAKVIERSLQPGQVVLILGKRAAAAFGLTHIQYFEWFALNHAKSVVVPHPSGASRWWNTLDNELQMIKFMHTVIKDLRQSVPPGWCIGDHDFDAEGNCKRCPKVLMTPHPETSTGR
jgi:uracil-DNA glycosylase